MASGEPAHSADIDVPALVAACAKHRDGARLSADKNVLCFDGNIMWDTPLDPFRELNSGGTLVVRSKGGVTIRAMQMADILMEKSAIVVIHDYCLSACANALFVASHETHVAEGAVVAWLGNSSNFPPMPVSEALTRQASGSQKERIALYQELRRNLNIVNEFYRKRGISDDFTRRPQTPYSRKMLHAMQREAYDKRSIFWTWHPDNFGNSFKSRIVFRSFPDQAAVESLVRAVYDPPGEPPPVRPYCQNGRAASGELCIGLRD
jgi:hypothetical protein